MQIKTWIIKLVKTAVSMTRLKYARLPQIRKKTAEAPKECFVLGNGPSLSVDLVKWSDRIKVADKICVNYFANSEFYDRIQPNSYLLLDPAFFFRNVSANHQELRNKLFQRISLVTTWEMQLFLPFRCEVKDDIERVFSENNCVKITYYNSNTFEGFDTVAWWFFRKNLAMPIAQNVLVAALFTVINLGYKTVLLIGADHSWHEEIVVGSNNVVCLKDRHFSDKDEAQLKPWYRDLAQNETWTMNQIFSALARMYEGYEIVEKYSRNVRVKIYNAGSRSFIDAFERII